MLTQDPENVTADKRRDALVDDEHVEDVRRIKLNRKTIVAQNQILQSVSYLAAILRSYEIDDMKTLSYL